MANDGVDVQRRRFHVQDLVPHLLVELCREHLREDVSSIVVRADLRDSRYAPSLGLLQELHALAHVHSLLVRFALRRLEQRARVIYECRRGPHLWVSYLARKLTSSHERRHCTRQLVTLSIRRAECREVVLSAVAVDRRVSHVLRVPSSRRSWLRMSCVRMGSRLVPFIVWRHCVRCRLQLSISNSSKRQAYVPGTE